MGKPQVSITQLKRQDLDAWSVLLRQQTGIEDLVVTAVTGAPLRAPNTGSYLRRRTRYTLTLSGHTDPITCIGKHTTQAEVRFFREVAPHLDALAPPCWFAEDVGDEYGWVILDDVPNQSPPERWKAQDVVDIVVDLADMHAKFWGKEEQLAEWESWLPHFVDRRNQVYTWSDLRREHAVYFEEGPGAILSEHALSHAGRLAPKLLQAANGLVVMQALGGWPGILGESHLAAAADLLDDPAPMLERLHDLPVTLLHGRPQNEHWRVTMFDDRRLVDWREPRTGPGILDLIYFVDQVDLLSWHEAESLSVQLRPISLVSKETIIDSYFLALHERLGQHFDARTTRQALPAARCLNVLIHWFAYFSNWFSNMPNKYTWQRINRMEDEQLQGTSFQTIIQFRPFLNSLFRQFLQSYRML